MRSSSRSFSASARAYKSVGRIARLVVEGELRVVEPTAETERARRDGAAHELRFQCFEPTDVVLDRGSRGRETRGEAPALGRRLVPPRRSRLSSAAPNTSSAPRFCSMASCVCSTRGAGDAAFRGGVVGRHIGEPSKECAQSFFERRVLEVQQERKRLGNVVQAMDSIATRAARSATSARSRNRSRASPSRRGRPGSA